MLAEARSRGGKKRRQERIFARMGCRQWILGLGCLLSFWLLLLVHLVGPTAMAGEPGGTCPGDCNLDWRVEVDELVQGLAILLGRSELELCQALDSNGDAEVHVDEIVAAVERSLNGCRVTPTPTDTPTETPTPTPTATVTPTAPVGPSIVFFGVTQSDDSLLTPTGSNPDDIPIYRVRVRSGFSLVVEAKRGASGKAVGDRSFDGFGAPDLQVQTTSQLGNGSEIVCDNDMVTPGGVPAINPPRFDDSLEVIDRLNDLGCRFLDGVGHMSARNCTEQACIRFETGQFGCQSEQAERQFCGLMTAALSFPLGDTLVTVRVLDTDGNAGLPAQLILRVDPSGD